ncbi:Formamidase [Sistotremastrum niveocremeum HHB9708]|uniref:Formamidase n=1 Tax=Sistotremastrum niveocremeum HHB9708 TaxID=1314777 RepID=A0A164MJN2_9AGAM|nr:Formamidase [Sistotremastrum niveocremeum HHB9708]
MSIHSVKRSQNHLAWDNSIPPVLRVKSGEEIEFDCLDASNGQINPESDSSTLAQLVFTQLDQVCGPVFVEGAEPGDVLQVEVLNIETAEWGWTALIPGFGLLSDEYPESTLKIWSINREVGYAWFDEEKKIKIPIKPFAGEMGVARKEDGAFSTIPPYNTGGNIDTRHVTVGSTLYLPIEVPGALFSMGDGHAAQGDGEVCGTAIETPIKVKVRLTVLKDEKKSRYVRTPHFNTTITGNPHAQHSNNTEDYYCTTGVGPDLRQCARDAVRSMIDYLEAEVGLNRVQAYMLCSIAGDLRLHEVVDMPNYVVGMMMPKSIFA